MRARVKKVPPYDWSKGFNVLLNLERTTLTCSSSAFTYPYSRDVDLEFTMKEAEQVYTALKKVLGK